MAVEPVEHFPDDVFNGLFGSVIVGFVRQDHAAGCAAIAADGLVKPFALERVGAGVVIGFSVDQQQW